MTLQADQLPRARILGVNVHMAQLSQAVSVIDGWVKDSDKCRFVVATGMHGVSQARKDPAFKVILNSADLFLPDGISLVWVGRFRGYPIKKRVPGPDLMWEYCKIAEQEGQGVFFYGDTEETLEALEVNLKEHFPRLRICGAISPPFRTLTEEEEANEIRIINDSGADVLWVGLGLPKQERWIYNNREKLKVPVAVAVGAAFRFNSGKMLRAPGWVGNNGFEWLWRFMLQPKRMWRRVLIDIPWFSIQIALETTGLKKFD